MATGMTPAAGLFLLIWALFLTAKSEGQNPYNPGPYQTADYVISPETDGSPLHSRVFYPLTKGTYSPILFIGGLYGYILAELYSTFLATVAAHGYIVVGIDPIYPLPPELVKVAIGDGKLRNMYGGHNIQGEGHFKVDASLVDKYFNQSEWLRLHLNNRTSAVPDWSKSAFMCHSASCDDILVIVNQSRSFIQAALFIDPVSYHAEIMSPIPSKVKTLTFMSELSEMSPACCIPGLGWKKIYDLMTCVKLRMEPKDHGHCDLLDQYAWEGCHVTKFCRTTNDTHLSDYRNFTAGVVTGFLQWTLYGDQDMMKYVTEPSYMPLPLVDIAYNTSCPS